MSILKIKNADGTWSDIPAIKGVDGKDGADGKDGSDGAPGKDGVIQYQAGDNIKIEGNVISAEVPDTGIAMEDVTNITGFLSDLDTEDKTNLVNAINEAFNNIGSGNSWVTELTKNTGLKDYPYGFYTNPTASFIYVSFSSTAPTSSNGIVLGRNSVILYAADGGTPIIVKFEYDGFTVYHTDTTKYTYLKYASLMTLSTNQTITGTKTFNTLPQSSKTPSNSKDLTTKAYVDSAIAASSAGSGSALEALVTVDFSNGSFLNVAGITVDYSEEFADAVMRATENGTHYGIIIANTYLGMTYIHVNKTGSSNGNPTYSVHGVEYSMQSDLEYSYLGYFSHQACIDNEGNLVSLRENDIRSMNMDKILTMDNTTAYTPTGAYHPANKKYVDDAIAAMSGSGDGTNTGIIDITESIYVGDYGTCIIRNTSDKTLSLYYDSAKTKSSALMIGCIAIVENVASDYRITVVEYDINDYKLNIGYYRNGQVTKRTISYNTIANKADKSYVDSAINGLDIAGTVDQLGYVKEVSELNNKILENETTEVLPAGDDTPTYWETTIVKPGYTSGGQLANLITLRDLYFALAPRNLATGKVRNSKFTYSSDTDLRVLVAGNVINISGYISLTKGDLFDISWGSNPSNVSKEESPGLIEIYNPSDPFGGGNNFDVSGSNYFDEVQGNWYDDLTTVLYTLDNDNFLAGDINLKAVSDTGDVIPLQLINCGDFVDADGYAKDYQKWKLIIPWEARNHNNSTNYFTQSGIRAYINETFVTKHFFGLGMNGNVLKMQTSLLTDAGEYNTVAWDGSIQS